MITAGRTWRRIRASWRDTALLFREFRLPLLLFLLVTLGSGLLYYRLSLDIPGQASSLVHGIYITMALAFFQSSVEFPRQWYLQVFHFVMPLIGLSILAQGLADFGVMLFNRRARGKEWEMAVASTFSNHVVLVGLGHLGFRVVKQLSEFAQDVVVIERQPDADLLKIVRGLGVPVIEDDGTRESTLAAAGIPRARAIILCTQDDNVNLRMALKARSLNPTIEVVIRIFDDEFAASLETQFGFHAMSATGMAAPLFAAIAAQVNITPPINIDGTPHILAHLLVHPRSNLKGKTVNVLEETYRISVVMLCKDGQREFHPPNNERIEPGQTVAIFGEPAQIHKILHENHR
jgi:Trk K+ transport system NAD-binding subunit